MSHSDEQTVFGCSGHGRDDTMYAKQDIAERSKRDLTLMTGKLDGLCTVAEMAGRITRARLLDVLENILIMRTVGMLAGIFALLLLGGCREMNRGDTEDAHGGSGSSQSSTVVAPSVATPQSALCGMTGQAHYPQLSGIDEFAWASEQIIVGTVTDQLPSQWSQPLTVGMEKETGGVSRTITTDYVVQVQSRLRGNPLDTVTVMTEGGSIGGCTIRNPDTGTLSVGERAMLFLAQPELNRPSQSTSGDPIYTLVGGQSGHLIVKDADSVAPFTDPSDIHPYNDLANSVLSTLRSGSPPTDMALSPVFLEEAPAATTVTPLINP